MKEINNKKKAEKKFMRIKELDNKSKETNRAIRVYRGKHVGWSGIGSREALMKCDICGNQFYGLLEMSVCHDCYVKRL